MDRSLNELAQASFTKFRENWTAVIEKVICIILTTVCEWPVWVNTTSALSAHRRS